MNDVIKTAIRTDREFRARWKQYPGEMPEGIKRVLRTARKLNRRIIAEIRRDRALVTSEAPP